MSRRCCSTFQHDCYKPCSDDGMLSSAYVMLGPTTFRFRISLRTAVWTSFELFKSYSRILVASCTGQDIDRISQKSTRMFLLWYLVLKQHLLVLSSECCDTLASQRQVASTRSTVRACTDIEPHDYFSVHRRIMRDIQFILISERSSTNMWRLSSI